MFICLNGQFVRADRAKVSIFDHGFLYGDGVYETLRTYNGKIWQLEDHLDRLEKSAKSLSLKLPYSRLRIAEMVEKLIVKNGFNESRIRITVTRGQAGFNFMSCVYPTLLIVVEKLSALSEKFYKNGVKVVTIREERTLSSAKTISLLPMILAQQEAKKHGVYGGIFVDKGGYVREGSITNIFLVKNGLIFVPKTGILLGTTRKMVLKIARNLGLKVRIMDFTLRKLYNADEVFITNTTKGIIPVNQVDNRKIGSGRPGKITKILMNALHEYIKEKTS